MQTCISIIRIKPNRCISTNYVSTKITTNILCDIAMQFKIIIFSQCIYKYLNNITVFICKCWQLVVTVNGKMPQFPVSEFLKCCKWKLNRRQLTQKKKKWNTIFDLWHFFGISLVYLAEFMTELNTRSVVISKQIHTKKRCRTKHFPLFKHVSIFIPLDMLSINWARSVSALHTVLFATG